MKIVVLGGCGKQGRVISSELINSGFDVSIVDNVGGPDIYADLSDYRTIRDTIEDCDLVIGALPSKLGYKAMCAAVDSGINYIDLSFMVEDPSRLHNEAVLNKSIVIHDCGIAPGISNLIVGRALELGASNISIMVGGFAKEPEKDYVITWNLRDLYHEYTRPARIIDNGHVIKVAALSGETTENIPSLGEVSCFYTDGLRSLVNHPKIKNIKSMVEKTIRWPGHLDIIKDFVNSGHQELFVADMEEKYSEHDDDVLVMRIRVQWERKMSSYSSEIDLVQYGTPDRTAMAHTTAMSCCAFAMAVAEGVFDEPGVHAPEYLASSCKSYKYILDKLRKHDIVFGKERYPFDNIVEYQRSFM